MESIDNPYGHKKKKAAVNFEEIVNAEIGNVMRAEENKVNEMAQQVRASSAIQKPKYDTSFDSSMVNFAEHFKYLQNQTETIMVQNNNQIDSIEHLPEKLLKLQKAEHQFKELSPTAEDFIEGINFTAVDRVKKEEEEIRFRKVCAELFKIYDSYSNESIFYKLESIADELAFHAASIFRYSSKPKSPELRQTRYLAVFQAIIYYYRGRKLIEDEKTDYSLVSIIVSKSLKNPPKKCTIKLNI